MKVCIAVVIATFILSAVLQAQGISDADIRAELGRRVLPGTGVAVGVQGGVVTLTGNVNSLPLKQGIIDLTRRTPGVRNVVDRITVTPAVRRSDADIASSVRSALTGNLSPEELSSLSIRVQNSVVILSGTLPSSYPKQVAGAVASLVPGVVDIRNEISVRPPQPRSDQQILADVGARYRNNPFLRPQDIRVSVTGGIVALTGTVNSFVVAEQAEAVARFVPGVIDVHNRLFVQTRPSAGR